MDFCWLLEAVTPHLASRQRNASSPTPWLSLPITLRAMVLVTWRCQELQSYFPLMTLLTGADECTDGDEIPFNGTRLHGGQ